jgi:hypothetical protein
MKLRPLLLPLALILACPGAALLAASPAAAQAPVARSTTAAALANQLDADAALAWLQDNFPPGSDLGLNADFLAAASDSFDDPENPSVRLYVYPANATTADGRPLWLAWIGLDDDQFVVLVGSNPASR